MPDYPDDVPERAGKPPRGPGKWITPAWTGPASPQSPVFVPDPDGQLALFGPEVTR